MATQLPVPKFMDDMGQCDMCPALLPPLDQVRPLYHSRTICFHCVMIGLHLGGFRPETPVVVSAHLLRRLRDGELRDNLTGLPVGPQPTGIVRRFRTYLRRLWDKARELWGGLTDATTPPARRPGRNPATHEDDNEK